MRFYEPIKFEIESEKKVGLTQLILFIYFYYLFIEKKKNTTKTAFSGDW
jgi:hypothetical protein